ncbi:hypothetical protein J1792_32845 [Streptomyces triculaminicus]|uniref:Ketosteroid isomerase n=2 Tax=Streptomyces TaxID=1883 RepID=A0A939JV06_9ACTN|nr:MULTISPECIES: hypothetical protein [Streptomyces]MBO0657329.1 hypothetical protein [Streptomyces triculaminicus]QSY49356.1 hypothetical protein J3S04_31265 [Streptomyces griseocarneus]
MTNTVIQNALRALVSRDPDQIFSVLTEDAEWLSPPGNATAVALKTPQAPWWAGR